MALKEHRGFSVCAGIGYFMLIEALHYNRGEVFLLYVNVHVLQKVCVAQILIYHRYLFIFYFKRKPFQNVLQRSEMYLMPKTSLFFSWLYVWLTRWGKWVKTFTLRVYSLYCTALGRYQEAWQHDFDALPLVFTKRLEPGSCSDCTEFEGGLAISSPGSRIKTLDGLDFAVKYPTSSSKRTSRLEHE